MKARLPFQLIVAFAIILVGGGALGGEYLLVKWYPIHQQRIADATLRMLPYRNEGLGLEMQVAAGLYGKVDNFPGGVRIYRPKLMSKGPSLTITSQPNPDGATDFSPQVLAQWEAKGATQNIPRYSFESTKINSRNAALVWQWQPSGSSMLLTAHLISPDRVIQVDCTPGAQDESVYLQACDESVRSIKLSGAPTPAEKPVLENVPPSRR